MNKSLVTVSLLLCFVTPSLWVLLEPPALAQTQSDKKTAAERLLKLCRENLSQNQTEAAIQSCQQAVTAHQQIKDRAGEAKSTVNLGIAYSRRGQYSQAIEYFQQSLAIFKEIGDRNGEARSLNNLGIAYPAFLSHDELSRG
jgi:tetratricopeptide (TPR) repeat protein